jgi:hypothetical protein
MNITTRRLVLLVTFSTALSAAIGGCRSTYYSVWQHLGYEKRDILVSRVEKARDEQTQAKQEFKTTLDRFKELTNFQGGDLEAEYKKLNSAYESCESRAAAVTKHINSVDQVAQDLFVEWQKELQEYHDEKLRAASQQQLDDSKKRYATLLAMMRRSEATMQPVLGAFHDQVLFLKHNLNAAAVNSLQTTAAGDRH